MLCYLHDELPHAANIIGINWNPYYFDKKRSLARGGGYEYTPVAIGNGGHGVESQADYVLIGSSSTLRYLFFAVCSELYCSCAAELGNVIAANGGDGIHIYAASYNGHYIFGNLIGNDIEV